MRRTGERFLDARFDFDTALTGRNQPLLCAATLLARFRQLGERRRRQPIRLALVIFGLGEKVSRLAPCRFCLLQFVHQRTALVIKLVGRVDQFFHFVASLGLAVT
ncbi:hypothetical protein D9M70_564510 [compost metagenome]